MTKVYSDEEWATLQEIADSGAAGFVPGLDDEEARCWALYAWGSVTDKDGRYYVNFLGRVDLLNRPGVSAK